MYQFEAVHRWAEKMRQSPRVVERHMTQSGTRLAMEGEGLTKAGTPVRTGTLRRSIAHRKATFGGGVVRSSWGTATPYARPVEYGRRGFSASPGKVLRFVPKGGTNPIFRKRVGPAKGHFMFRNAMNRIRPMVPREFAAAMRRVIAELGG